MRARAEVQISAFLSNSPGVVAHLCEALREYGVNIRAVAVMDTVDIGTIRMVTDDVDTAKDALQNVGAAFVERPVLSVLIPNRPGELSRVAQQIASHGVNIEYFYASAAPETSHCLAIFRVSDIERALKIDFED